MATKTQEHSVYELIGLPPGGLFVTGIETRLWGKTHIVAFDYNSGSDNEKRFKLIFENCHELNLADDER